MDRADGLLQAGSVMEPKTLATFVLVGVALIVIEIQLYIGWRLIHLIVDDIFITRAQLRERGILLPKLEVEE